MIVGWQGCRKNPFRHWVGQSGNGPVGSSGVAIAILLLLAGQRVERPAEGRKGGGRCTGEITGHFQSGREFPRKRSKVGRCSPSIRRLVTNSFIQHGAKTTQQITVKMFFCDSKKTLLTTHVGCHFRRGHDLLVTLMLLPTAYAQVLGENTHIW